MTALAPVVGAYFATVNTIAVGLFWYDKRQAEQRRWRVPERTLQLSALVGGWMGGFIAIQRFRHKNKKQAFLTPYYAATGLNVAGTVLLAAMLRRRGITLNTTL
eukprot:EG_transcript_59030